MAVYGHADHKGNFMVRRNPRPLPVVSFPSFRANGGGPFLNRAWAPHRGRAKMPVHGSGPRTADHRPIRNCTILVQPSPLYQKMRNEPNKSFVINKSLEERTQMLRETRYAKPETPPIMGNMENGDWKLRLSRQSIFQFPFSDFHLSISSLHLRG